MLVFAANLGGAQTVLYSTDFDGPEMAAVADGWTKVPGSLHEAADTPYTKPGVPSIPSWLPAPYSP